MCLTVNSTVWTWTTHCFSESEVWRSKAGSHLCPFSIWQSREASKMRINKKQQMLFCHLLEFPKNCVATKKHYLRNRLCLAWEHCCFSLHLCLNESHSGLLNHHGLGLSCVSSGPRCPLCCVLDWAADSHSYFCLNMSTYLNQNKVSFLSWPLTSENKKKIHPQ